jgi:hypothetical protein
MQGLPPVCTVRVYGVCITILTHVLSDMLLKSAALANWFLPAADSP